MTTRIQLINEYRAQRNALLQTVLRANETLQADGIRIDFTKEVWDVKQGGVYGPRLEILAYKRECLTLDLSRIFGKKARFEIPLIEHGPRRLDQNGITLETLTSDDLIRWARQCFKPG